jgi:hypothetical protein
MDRCNPVGTIPTVDAHGSRPLGWVSGSESTNDRFVGWSGAAPTLGNMAWPEAAAVVMQGRQPCDGGTDHHDDHNGGGVGQQLRAEAP